MQPHSPLTARMLGDGSMLRAAFGSRALLVPMAAAGLALLALADTGGLAVAPALSLMLALMLIGILDASAGFLAACVFMAGVVVLGGVTSVDSVRSLLGIGALWYAPVLIAGKMRSFRGKRTDDWAQRWSAVADVVMGSLLAAWAVQGATSALPGLSGLDMPISRRADFVAGVTLCALVVRYLLERLAARLYTERLKVTTFVPTEFPGTKQRVGSIMVKAFMFVFVLLPYVGWRWELGLVTAFSVVPSLLELVQDRFPSSRALSSALPRGVPNTLLSMTVGAVLGKALADRIHDPAQLFAVAFVVLALPGFAQSMLSLVGREGPEPAVNWPRRFAGLWVAVVALVKIRGGLGSSTWLPLQLIAPLIIWWIVATIRAARAESAKATAAPPAPDGPTAAEALAAARR